MTAVSIAEREPKSASVSTATSGTFTDQLVTSGGNGSVTYTETTSPESGDVIVSSTGGVTTSGTLPAGTYSVSGTTGDAYGDSGTWTFTLKVTAGEIGQTTPASGSVTTATSATFTDQLTVSGNTGAVTFTETTSPDSGDVMVSSTGAVTTKGTLHTGTYTVSGTTSDTELNGGTWTYTLTVTGVPIGQTTPTSGSVTTTTSGGFSDQLAVSGNIGTVTYTETTSPHSSTVLVSTSGKVTTKGTLAAGSYTVSGAATDIYGDSGTWTFTLTVTAVTLAQTTPTSGSVTTTTSGSFSDQLVVTGSPGSVSYTETTSPASATVLVSTSGQVTTKGALAAGTYSVSGITGDGYGDSGTWTFTLTVTAVTLAQTTPTSGSVTTTTSGSFSDQLVVTGSPGAVSYTETTSTTSTAVLVSTSGQVTTSGPLAAGTYTVSGTTSDGYGDSGTWTFNLTVTAVTLAQATPTSSSVITTTSGSFSDQLVVTGSPGAVTFGEATSTTSTAVLVSTSGQVTTKGALAAGTYSVSGITGDGYGDSGTWTFTLTVTAVTLAQTTPTSSSVTTTTSGSFGDQLVVTGSPGAVSYTETTSTTSTAVLVSTSGQLTTRRPAGRRHIHRLGHHQRRLRRQRDLDLHPDGHRGHPGPDHTDLELGHHHHIGRLQRPAGGHRQSGCGDLR